MKKALPWLIGIGLLIWASAHPVQAGDTVNKTVRAIITVIQHL